MRERFMNSISNLTIEGNAGATGGGTPAPSAPAVQDGSATMDQDALVNLFHHDPLSDTPASGPGEGTPPSQQPAGTTQSAAPGTSQPPQATQPTGDATAIELAALRQRYDALEQRVGQAQPPQQSQVQQPQQQEQIPDYNFTIPPQITEALAHENPVIRGQALGAVIKATAQTVHRAVVAQVTQEIAKLRESVPQLAHGVVHSTQIQRTVYDDFYGKYPEYNNPAIYSVVANTLQTILREKPQYQAGGWTPQLRDEVAARLKTLIQVVQPQAQPGGTPPVVIGSGARPAAERLNGQDRQLADLFG
jgi:hypothetical protein